MSKRIVLVLMLMGFLSVPRAAHALFFDGDPWYMNPSWWVDYAEGTPPSGKTAEFVDTPTNNRLDWLTSGWTTGEGVLRVKASRWAFELSDDFEFTVDFRYDHTGSYDTDEGGIEMGLYYWFDELDGPHQASVLPSHIFNIAADNWVRDWDGPGPEGLSNKNVFWASVMPPQVGSWWERDSSDGMLLARYYEADDRLILLAFESGNNTPVGGVNYEGLQGNFGLSQLGVYFAGWSEGAGLASGDAYFENFNVIEGTITPEPVGSILFLIGGVSLAIFKYKRR